MALNKRERRKEKNMGKEIDYDYRLPEDRLSGKGYRIRCNSCGMSTLSSHDRYCPFCGPDTVTPFVSERIDLTPYVQVTYRVSGTFAAKIPVNETGWPFVDEEALLEIERMAGAILARTGFGQLSEIEHEVMGVTDPSGKDLLKEARKN